MIAGRLDGIARHSRPRGPVETIRSAVVNTTEGIKGDFRGAVLPGKRGKRQISLIEAESWAAAMADLGLSDVEMVPWHLRRANLLLTGLRLPRQAGTILSIGSGLRIAITQECDPCSRMEEVYPGLKAALTPDWRGGFLGRVLNDGTIAIGDEVRIEQ